jgi:hypothetical protein
LFLIEQSKTHKLRPKRDLNPVLNLAKIGRATPEFMPVDKNRRAALVEAGSNTDSSLNE